jgi:SP family general alpha glucoside:H+ symporter-like MFS transporter
MGYSVYFFKQAGIATDVALDFSISFYGVAMIGVVISWFAMTNFGRRTIFLTGLSCNFIVLMTIGFVSLATQATKRPVYATGALLLVFTLVYDVTVRTVAYSIDVEIPSDRLRTKAIVLYVNLYNVMGTINGVITPYMLNPSAWRWRGKAGFFWAGLRFLYPVWTYFRLPEPKGRTYGELDILFEKKASARKFAKAVVDPFAIDYSLVMAEATVEKD